MSASAGTSGGPAAAASSSQGRRPKLVLVPTGDSLFRSCSDPRRSFQYHQNSDEGHQLGTANSYVHYAATRMLFRRCSLVCRPRKPISALSPKTCRLPGEPGYHDFSLDFLEGVPDFDGKKGGPEAGNLYSTPGRRLMVSLPSRASFDCTWATALARGARLPIACLWRRLICS